MISIDANSWGEPQFEIYWDKSLKTMNIFTILFCLFPSIKRYRFSYVYFSEFKTEHVFSKRSSMYVSSKVLKNMTFYIKNCVSMIVGILTALNASQTDETVESIAQKSDRDEAESPEFGSSSSSSGQLPVRVQLIKRKFVCFSSF